MGGQFGDGKRHRTPAAVVPVPKHDGQQAQQRQHAAGQREEEELDRRVTPLLASPDADEEEKRHERELEEQVEENNVAGDEHAEHARAQDQQQTVVQRLLVLDGFPTYQHGDDQQQGGEREEPEAQAVQGDAEADVQRNARGGEPWVVGGREGCIAGMEASDQHDRPHERRQRGRQGPAAGLRPPDAGQDRGSRGKQQRYEQHGFHR